MITVTEAAQKKIAEMCLENNMEAVRPFVHGGGCSGMSHSMTFAEEKEKRDIEIAYSIVELFKRREDIENFNKKALYILIREMTDVNTTHITAVVNVFKKHYKIIMNNYYTNGYVEIKKNNKFF